MPLIILGSIVVIGIVIYALLQYGNSGEVDTRPVRERYPHAFPPKEGNANDRENSSEGNTMHFPDDAELEKRKRNIH